MQGLAFFSATPALNSPGPAGFGRSLTGGNGFHLIQRLQPATRAGSDFLGLLPSHKRIGASMHESATTRPGACLHFRDIFHKHALLAHILSRRLITAVTPCHRTENMWSRRQQPASKGGSLIRYVCRVSRR